MFDPYTRNKGNVSPYNPRVFSKLKLNHVKPHSVHYYSEMETMEHNVMGFIMKIDNAKINTFPWQSRL